MSISRRDQNAETSTTDAGPLLRCAGLLLLPLLGGVIGFALASAAASGLFSPWQPIAPPPEPVARIAALDGASIWVEGISGVFYNNPSSDSCQRDCWVVVAAPPTQPATHIGVDVTLSRTCVGPAPLPIVKQILSECQREQWSDISTAYALRADGRLFAWHFESGGEGPPAVVFTWPCGGVFIALILAVCILVYDLVKRTTPKPAQP